MQRNSVTVLVNSAFRDKAVHPNPNRFTVNLPVHLRDVRGVTVKDFYTYSNEAEYLIIVVKQFAGSILTNPEESQWRIPSNAIHISDTLCRTSVGRDIKYVSNSVTRACFDVPIGVLKQMDIEVYGRPYPGHVVLAAPTPIQLFPFTVPGHEWAAVFEFDCTYGISS